LKLRFFIEYRYDEASSEFKPIGVWMHNPAAGDVDIYYPDEASTEYEGALWVINRLVDAGLKTPEDFLDYHQQRAGYRGMRGSIREIETDLNYNQFGRSVLQDTIEREGNAVSN